MGVHPAARAGRRDGAARLDGVRLRRSLHRGDLAARAARDRRARGRGRDGAGRRSPGRVDLLLHRRARERLLRVLLPDPDRRLDPLRRGRGVRDARGERRTVGRAAGGGARERRRARPAPLLPLLRDDHGLGAVAPRAREPGRGARRARSRPGPPAAAHPRRGGRAPPYRRRAPRPDGRAASSSSTARSIARGAIGDERREARRCSAAWARTRARAATRCATLTNELRPSCWTTSASSRLCASAAALAAEGDLVVSLEIDAAPRPPARGERGALPDRSRRRW